MTKRSIAALVTSFAMLGLLSGCGSDADVDVNMDGTMDIETEEGTAKIGAQSLPEGWPGDAPIYPGSAISYSASMNPQTGEPSMAVVLSTKDTVSAAATYYKTELASKGWSVDTAMEAGGTSIFSATKEGSVLSLLIAGAEGQTTITMAIENRETE